MCNKGEQNSPRRYARPGQVCEQYSIRRTTLYKWHRLGYISLIQVRVPGARKGTTLVDLHELEQFLERHRTRGAKEEVAE